MNVKINPLGSGACPICKLNSNCLIHSTIKNALIDIKEKEIDDWLEMAIYRCPHFQEINT